MTQATYTIAMSSTLETWPGFLSASGFSAIAVYVATCHNQAKAASTSNNVTEAPYVLLAAML
jgi:xanthine/uracil/vitamin C permease (AzgA family)